MLRRPLSLALLLFLGCSVPPPLILSPEKLHKVDEVMQAQVANQKIAGGIVAVAYHGESAFSGVYGYLDAEAKTPMPMDAIFRIYSMTKAIVSAAALTLVDDGKLSIDDPVAKWVPEFKDIQVNTAEGKRAPSRPPTVKDLFLHCSGLTYGGGDRPGDAGYKEKKPLESKDLDEMAAKLGAIGLAFDPGKDWCYSVSIDVLGLVVERVSKQKLDQFLEERIFKPLRMTDTAFFVPSDKVARFSPNYSRDKGGLKVIDAVATSKYLQKPSFLSGGGGLVSTARNYLRFMLMIDNGGFLEGAHILQPATVKLMTTNQLPAEAFPIYFGKTKRTGTGFGLGFSVRVTNSEWDPAGREGEYGWGGAASTHYWTSPKDHLVVVTLEQIMPYNFDTEFAVKGPLYDAMELK